MPNAKTHDNTVPAEPVGAALEVAAPTPLAAFHDDEWADVDDGLIGWEHIGLTMPRLISDMRPGGGWRDETTGEKIDHLNVVLLAMAPGRAWWEGEYGQGTNVPDCRSADMIRPDPTSPKLQSDLCATCPRARWRPGNEAPECGTRINALVYDVDGAHLARTAFGGTGIKQVKRYLSYLKSSVPPRRPVSVVTTVTLKEEEGKGRRWLEPQFAVSELLRRADAEPLLRLRDEMLGMWRSALATDLAQPDAEIGDTAAAMTEGPFDDTPAATFDAGAPTYDADSEPF